MAIPAVFLDRDGVINRNRADHVKCWEEFEFLPGALEALQLLAQVRLPVIVVSNQGAIGRGLTTRAAVDDTNWRMVEAIRRAGGRVDDVLYCPHRPEDGCECRKPRPGLLLEAAERWDLDLRGSILVGDAHSDVLAAENAGCRALLVLTGRGREQIELLARSSRQRWEVVADLAAAIQQIQVAARAADAVP
jgi:D-glycero-D-manno-heptose 1,7-bisphosphate phosphatase